MSPSMRILPLALMLVGTSTAAAPVIWLDAGHGGSKPGAPGPKGKMEKEITLQLVKRLKAELEKGGATVKLTREKDQELGLQDRIRMANAANGDLFVSVHCNSMPVDSPSRRLARGVETYFLSAEATGEQASRVAAYENAEAGPAAQAADPLQNILNDLAQTEAHHEASALAYAVQRDLVKGLQVPDRGVQQAPFLVLMGAKMPAVLVEVGFLSHASEGLKLTEAGYQGKVAGSLAAGIKAFLADRAAKAGGSAKAAP